MSHYYPRHVSGLDMPILMCVTYMLLLNCALKLVEEIILYYDARSKKHQIRNFVCSLLEKPTCLQNVCCLIWSQKPHSLELPYDV